MKEQAHLPRRGRAGGHTHPPGADRDQQQLVQAPLPFQVEARHGRHEVEEQAGVVVGRDAAIHKDMLAATQDDGLRGEKGRGGGAGPHQLPEGDAQIALRRGGVVEFGGGIVGDGPGGTGGIVAHHQAEQGAQFAGAQQGRHLARRILREHLLEHGGDGLRGIFAAPALVPGRGPKDVHPAADVEVFDLRDRHAPGQAGGDDAAGAGPGDVVEVVRQDQSGPAGLGAQQGLHPRQHLQGEDTADAATVQGQESFHGASLSSHHLITHP